MGEDSQSIKTLEYQLYKLSRQLEHYLESPEHRSCSLSSFSVDRTGSVTEGEHRGARSAAGRRHAHAHGEVYRRHQAVWHRWLAGSQVVRALLHCRQGDKYIHCVLLPPANEVWGKVMFLHLCVILFTGGVCIRGASASKGGVCIQDGFCPPCQILHYTVIERAVRILLECILIE